MRSAAFVAKTVPLLAAVQESEEDEGPEDMSDGASSTRSSAKEMEQPFADISNVRPGSGLKGGLVKAYDVERREMEDMCATIIQRHWRGVLGRRYAHEEWKNAKYNAEAKSIASIVEAYAGFIEGMQEEPREHVKARNEKTYMKSKRRADAKGSAAGGRAAGGAGGSFLPPVNPDESMNSTGRRKAPPLPFASAAFVANTPPLPCASTAFTTNTAPFIAVPRRLAAEESEARLGLAAEEGGGRGDGALAGPSLPAQRCYWNGSLHPGRGRRTQHCAVANDSFVELPHPALALAGAAIENERGRQPIHTAFALRFHCVHD